MSLSLLQAGAAGIGLLLPLVVTVGQGPRLPVEHSPQSTPAAARSAEQARPIEHLETPTGVAVPGRALSPDAVLPGVVETMDAVLAREASRIEPGVNPKLRGGRQGSWEVPSRRRKGFPHSGEHVVTARWGDRSMGIGFPDTVRLEGVWIAGHATPQVWAPAVRAVGFRLGREVSSTAWFEDVDATPSWFAIDFDEVDRVVFEARVAYAGAGFYGLDDLTFVHPRAGRIVLDFEDLDYRAPLTGTGYAGLVWEQGTGDFTQAVHPPMVPPAPASG